MWVNKIRDPQGHFMQHLRNAQFKEGVINKAWQVVGSYTPWGKNTNSIQAFGGCGYGIGEGGISRAHLAHPTPIDPNICVVQECGWCKHWHLAGRPR